jgi:glycosyltransferase involved in cell wall biosynthesis
MKVPILLMSNWLGQGGSERQTALTALHLDRARFEPHIACCEGGFWEERLRDAGIPIFFIGPRSLGLSAVREGRRLRAYIREHGIRIVQAFDFAMNFLGVPVARSVPGVTTISSLRCHIDLIPARYRWLNHLAWTISSGVVVNSEALRRELSDAYSVPSRKVFTCYNGLDTAVFHPRPRMSLPGLEGAALVIGTVCVLRPEKHLPLLLEAFAVAFRRNPGICLLITGSGPEEASLRGLAQTLDIGEKCVFIPSTPDVAGIFPAIDVFVLPSLSEGFPNALMEAMACGCCVLASDVGGNPELVQNGVTGLLFPSRDRDALVEGLLKVIDDAALRQRLGSAAAETVSREFSLEHGATRMQEIYETILSGGSADRRV